MRDLVPALIHSVAKGTLWNIKQIPHSSSFCDPDTSEVCGTSNKPVNMVYKLEKACDGFMINAAFIINRDGPGIYGAQGQHLGSYLINQRNCYFVQKLFSVMTLTILIGNKLGQ